MKAVAEHTAADHDQSFKVSAMGVANEQDLDKDRLTCDDEPVAPVVQNDHEINGPTSPSRDLVTPQILAP